MTRSSTLPFAYHCLALLALPVLIAHAAEVVNPATGPRSYLVYAGTSARTGTNGIYAWRMDAATGALTSLGLAADTPNPSFLEVAPNQRFLYAVNGVGSFGGKPGGSVSAFSIDAESGKLMLLNQQTSGGRGVCHVTLDREGKNALVANYSDGTFECLPVQADGRLGTPTAFIQHSGKSIVPDRQDGPHAHCTVLDAAGRFAFVCDLGLDKIMGYRLDAKLGTLAPNQPAFTAAKPGAGPRHLVFHPNGRQAYVINELNSTVVRYTYDPGNGTLTETQSISSLPPEFTGANTGAEVAVHPSGKYLYASNRGDDSIVAFTIDGTTGKLSYLQRFSTQGKTPRFFTLDPSGRFLFAANQDSDTMVVFNLNPADGKLSPTGQVLKVPAPMCIKFVPAP